MVYVAVVYIFPNPKISLKYSDNLNIWFLFPTANIFWSLFWNVVLQSEI